MGDDENGRNKKGRVCVTGGTGYLGSWMVMRLLQQGYSVNTTIRQLHPDRKRDVRYLTELPGASERLKIFEAELDRPESFGAAITGCVGVFHMANSLDFENKAETEGVRIAKSVDALLAILKACVDSKTVKRVVYTSSDGAAALNRAAAEAGVADENSWTDLEFLRSLGVSWGPYAAAKTLTERAAWDFADKHGLDLVTVLPSLIHGPFICPRCPDSVYMCMSLILGDKNVYESLPKTILVHVDDVVRAHIHVFEYPEAKGRYLCSSSDVTLDGMHEFISATYPQFELPSPDSWKSLTPSIFPDLSTKKLLETGFKYENGLREMYDGAIKSCKDIGLLQI